MSPGAGQKSLSLHLDRIRSNSSPNKQILRQTIRVYLLRVLKLSNSVFTGEVLV